MTATEILNSGKYNLIDVREPMELEMDGSIENAVNIPLSMIPLKIEEIKQMEGAKVIFCRSGGRSGQACQFLAQNGFEDVYNGGGFMQLKQYLDSLK